MIKYCPIARGRLTMSSSPRDKPSVCSRRRVAYVAPVAEEFSFSNITIFLSAYFYYNTLILLRRKIHIYKLLILCHRRFRLSSLNFPDRCMVFFSIRFWEPHMKMSRPNSYIHRFHVLTYLIISKV